MYKWEARHLGQHIKNLPESSRGSIVPLSMHVSGPMHKLEEDTEIQEWAAILSSESSGCGIKVSNFLMSKQDSIS